MKIAEAELWPNAVRLLCGFRLLVEAMVGLTLKNSDMMKKFLALLATVLVAASAFAGEFPDISIAEVKALSESKKATIIDVNGTDSYKKNHVPGALNFDSIQANLAKSLPADKNAEIIAYCGSPKCKAYQEAANAAHKLGYKNVKHMSAGISGWVSAGMKTESAK